MTLRALAAAAAAALLLAPAAHGGTVAGEDGYDVLVRTVDASRSTPYSGEALSVVFGADRPYVTMLRVAVDGEGEVAVEPADRGGAAGGRSPEAAGGGLAIPLPMVPGDDAPRGPLRRNYDVEIEGRDAIMARPATVLAFFSRADRTLRERLWVDEASSLPLRRETYDRDGALVRLGAFLSLELDPAGSVPPAGAEGFVELDGLVPVEGAELEALRKAGWQIPDALPGGYEAVAAYAVAGGEAQPLKVVYADGLYTVSVFQQAGAADWDSLPAGAQHLEELPGEVYAWPGALPHRLVWSADGRTWSMIGDAPPDDLREIALALPQADPPGAVERLRRGFSRLWRGVSKWGAELWS